MIYGWGILRGNLPINRLKKGNSEGINNPPDVKQDLHLKEFFGRKNR